MMQQFLPDNSEKPFHSSGYAAAAHGQSIGSTSAQSYEERLRIERNRRHVRRYGHSMLGRVDPAVRSRTTQPNGDTARAQLNTGSGRPVDPPAPRPSGFREPPTRSYNPYQ